MKSPKQPAGLKNRAKQGLAAKTVKGASVLQRLGFPLVIVLATIIAFLPALQNGFVDWDDNQNLVNNPAYRGLGWSQIHWMFTTFHLGHYQPLSWVTFGIDYLIWGLDPLGYHLTNLLFHAANAVLFYFISRRLLSIALLLPEKEDSWELKWSALFAALLFAIHPLRVESVAWATERRDVLSGFFFLWTIYCYLRAVGSATNQPRQQWLCAALLVYILSLLSKATAITLPVVLIALDFYPLRRLRGGPVHWFTRQFQSVLWEKLPFIFLAFVFAVVALLAQHSIGALKPVQQYDFISRFAQAAYGLIFYLWKFLLPTHLSPLYELPYDATPWILTFAVSAVGAAAMSLGVYLLRRRWPAMLACWIYYVVMLAPVLGIAQSGPQLVADRYSYLPSLSWALLFAGALIFYRLPSSGPSLEGQRRLVPVTVIGVCAAFILGFLTWRQIGVWHDTRTLWEYVIATTPESSIAHYNLGKTFETEGRLDRAIELYRRAVSLNPGYADAHHNLARLLARNGQLEEAIEHYRLALAVIPDDVDTHNNLGLLLAIRGDIKASLAELQRAVQIDPNYARAYFNMGRIFAEQGDLDRALVNYQKALKLDPDEAEIRLGLGNVLVRQGDLEAAGTQFQQAVNIKPDFADAHVALARVLAAQGKKSEAERHYELALQLMKAQRKPSPSR